MTNQMQAHMMDPLYLQPLHDVQDRDKVLRLRRSMRRHGWVGAPLIKWDDQLLTGVHRRAAAMSLGIDVPVIELGALYDAAGLDLAELHEAHGAPVMGEWRAIVALLDELPADTRAAYGIDVH